MSYKNISNQMKEYPHWIVWKLEERDGKKTKVPHCVRGGNASVSNPQTWASFDEAVQTLQGGAYNGIGFVFTGTPFIGVDIDGCINVETGEITPEAKDALDTLNSYTEVSQSGTGFHIILEGQLPDGRRRKGNFEMYGDGSPRYFAMTGNLWGEYAEIRADQGAIDTVHQKYIASPATGSQQVTERCSASPVSSGLSDQEIIERAGAAKNGGKFTSLWSGDTAGYENDDSRADLALCGILAFWCQRDPVSIDRLFRKSGLMRPKWGEMRGRDTYGNLTIEEAIANCKEVYKGGKARMDNTCPLPPTGGKVTQAETILALVEANDATLFCNQNNDPYASIPVDGHTEVWSVGSSDFSTYLHGLYYSETKQPVKKDAITQALAMLTARARFGGKAAVPLSTRVAVNDGAFWYDLSNPAWQAVKITTDGWEVVDNPPVLFNRYRHQSIQANPQPGGEIRKILQYINLKENHTLFLCWLVCCFIPEIPHAMPIFHGEKGAAKSTACSLLKRLIDPSVLETLTLQSNPKSLAVNLQQHWFLPFDNVSKVNEETSDTLCRAITGGGIQQRKLFTDADDYIFTFLRCLAINGINNVANRADLLDRSLLIELERISEADRRELSIIQAAFAEDLPSILGGIFDTLSKAMAIFPTVKLDKLPRMADYARWGYAVGEALGGYGQKFLDEYTANREIQNTEAINSDVVAVLVIEFMAGRCSWEGRVSELLAQLVEIAPRYGINPRIKEFPSQPNGLSRRLNGIKSNLQAVGVSFTKQDSMHGTVITLTNDKVPSLPPYHHTPGKLHPLTMEENIGGGDNQELPPYTNPLCDKGYGDNGGNGDESVTF